VCEVDNDFSEIALRYDGAVRWLIDGYNVIRRSSELSAAERKSLEAGRQALCRLLSRAAQRGGDHFTVVFDGAGGGSSSGIAGVRVVFSSARETADRVLARMAAESGAVVSSDREVRHAAARAGAIAISADEFLSRLDSLPAHEHEPRERERADTEEEDRSGPKKGNPRRLGKKARAAARALRRLGPK
jgi:predicted RNA-binding protein with PIN domain